MFWVGLGILLGCISLGAALVQVSINVCKCVAELAKDGSLIQISQTVTKDDAVPSNLTRSSSEDTEVRPSVERPDSQAVETGPTEEDLAILTATKHKTVVSFGEEVE